MNQTVKNQRGFGVLAIFLVTAVLGVIAFAGYAVTKNNQKPTPAVQQQTSSPPETLEPAEPVDPTADWKSYASKAGKYTLKHPNGWYEDSCDNDSDDLTLYLGTTKKGRVICNSEHGSQVMIVSTPAVPTESEQKLSSEYYKDITTKKVTVDGVRGERQSGKLKTDEFGVPANTLIVRYFFLKPGRSYIATYIQSPSGDYKTDNLVAFDLIVQETLKFTK